MKISKCFTFLSIALFLLGFNLVGAQILSNSVPSNSISGSNAFLDLSSNYSSAAFANNDLHKGLVFPDVDLTTFEFKSTFADFASFPSWFDGMLVYNRGTGPTSILGDNPNGSSQVSPGFYYFSNPNGAANTDISAGRWLPVGGQSATVRSKTVTVVVPANATVATLDLGTSVIAASEVNSFLGAKIYDNAGNLVMTADSAYNKATNLLTTGNGFMYQILAAGTYQVVVEYR